MLMLNGYKKIQEILKPILKRKDYGNFFHFNTYMI